MPADPRAVAYRAPLRIDLAGGTIDIWPLYLLIPGAVTVNVAITRFARVRLGGPRAIAPGPASSLVDRILSELGDGRLSVETHVECPRGSGLGGSSALAVALVRGLLERRGERPARDRVLRLARDLEAREIRTPAGDQDYLAALHGGLSVIRFGIGGPVVTHPDPAVARRLMERIVLFYTGLPHFSGINNWAVFRAAFDGDARVRRCLGSIAAVAQDVAAALAASDLDAAARLVAREWTYRRGLAKGITTPGLERAFAIGRRHHALAGKVCGAGGGGAAFLVAREGEAPRLAAAVAGAGFQVLPAGLALRGLSRAPWGIRGPRPEGAPRARGDRPT